MTVLQAAARAASIGLLAASLPGCPKPTPPSIKAGCWAHSGSTTDDLACASTAEHEPNGDVTMANLAAPTGCTPQSVAGQVAGDVDVFRVEGPKCPMSTPTAALTTRENDVRLCLFVVCGNGKTGISHCTGDPSPGDQAPVSSKLPEGMRGCCRVGAGSVSTDANCDAEYASIATSQPSWHAFLVVDRVRDTACTPYQLTYHF